MLHRCFMTAAILGVLITPIQVTHAGLIHDIIPKAGINGTVSTPDFAGTGSGCKDDQIQQANYPCRFVFKTTFNQIAPIDILFEVNNSTISVSEYWGRSFPFPGQSFTVTNSTKKTWNEFDLLLGFYDANGNFVSPGAVDLLDFDTTAGDIPAKGEKDPHIANLGLLLTESIWHSNAIAWKKGKFDTGVPDGKSFDLTAVPIDIPNFNNPMPAYARRCDPSPCPEANPNVIGYSFVLRLQPYEVPEPSSLLLVMIGVALLTIRSGTHPA